MKLSDVIQKNPEKYCLTNDVANYSENKYIIISNETSQPYMDVYKSNETSQLNMQSLLAQLFLNGWNSDMTFWSVHWKMCTLQPYADDFRGGLNARGKVCLTQWMNVTIVLSSKCFICIIWHSAEAQKLYNNWCILHRSIFSIVEDLWQTHPIQVCSIMYQSPAKMKNRVTTLQLS